MTAAIAGIASTWANSETQARRNQTPTNAARDLSGALRIELMKFGLRRHFRSPPPWPAHRLTFRWPSLADWFFAIGRPDIIRRCF